MQIRGSFIGLVLVGLSTAFVPAQVEVLLIPCDSSSTYGLPYHDSGTYRGIGIRGGPTGWRPYTPWSPEMLLEDGVMEALEEAGYECDLCFVPGCYLSFSISHDDFEYGPVELTGESTPSGTPIVQHDWRFLGYVWPFCTPCP